MEEARAAMGSIADVTDIPASAGAFYAASNVIEVACYNETDAFLLCKADNQQNPIKCLEQGKAATRCGLNVFRNIYSGPCASVFKSYVSALERNNLEFDRARAEEAAFDKCFNQQQ